MDMGPHTVQVIVSLVVVVVAAAVAIICDFLKRNNEHLRELAVELKVRNEEAERRIQVIEKRSKKTVEMKPAAAATATPKIAVPARPAPPSIASPAESVPSISTETARPRRVRREMSPAVAAVAEAANARLNPARPAAVALVAPAESESNESVELSPFNQTSAARKNWDSILKRTGQTRPQGALIAFESIREAVAVPAGYHEASVLQRAVESGRTVSGLVVSIGTNELNDTRSGEVAEFLRSMLGPQDFGCQSGDDEFVLMCPGEQGATAQRRLSAIAEKLWDFQLSSIGGLSVQFSWGSFEARGERIGEAVASAIEQMQETRQSRGRVTIAKAV